MKHNQFLTLISILIAGLLFAACTVTDAAQSTAAADIPVVVDDSAVVAEGRIVPADSVHLAFLSGGQIAEVLVHQGDVVAAGDVIARLDGREALEASVAGAELELAAAVLELAAAEADLLSSRQALEQINEHWPEQATLAQQALKDARQRQYNADRNLGYLTSSADQTDIDLAYTQMILAEDALEKAKDAFEPYENKPADNLVRAALQQKQAEAQKAYDAAVRRYNALVDTSNDFDISQAEAELAIANAQLEQAEEDYLERIAGPDPDDVDLAEARITAGEARLLAAEQRILTAQASLDAAQANLDNLDLTAPIAGTVVEIDLVPGEQALPGSPVGQIADFSNWYVETDNLTEIEVVDISTGQTVEAVADALPEVTLTGNVEEIGDIFVEKRGDVTYTARILLDGIDPRLRWGMTVVVTFK